MQELMQDHPRFLGDPSVSAWVPCCSMVTKYPFIVAIIVPVCERWYQQQEWLLSILPHAKSVLGFSTGVHNEMQYRYQRKIIRTLAFITLGT